MGPSSLDENNSIRYKLAISLDNQWTTIVILQTQLEMEAESACKRIRWIEPRNRKPKSKSARVQILETVDGLLNSLVITYLHFSKLLAGIFNLLIQPNRK
jgi:hypothetical protein